MVELIEEAVNQEEGYWVARERHLRRMSNGMDLKKGGKKR